MKKQTIAAPAVSGMKIENFGDMQARYGKLSLERRAACVLADAQPAIATAGHILETVSEHPKLKQAIDNLRKNELLISKMRGSEAKTILLDDSCDFIKSTMQKLAAWQKNLERIASGKTRVTLLKEHVPEHFAVTMAGVSGYLAIIKLIIPEIALLDKARQAAYSAMLLDMRRCATVLSDLECASELNSVILH